MARYLHLGQAEEVDNDGRVRDRQHKEQKDQRSQQDAEDDAQDFERQGQEDEVDKGKVRGAWYGDGVLGRRLH